MHLSKLVFENTRSRRRVIDALYRCRQMVEINNYLGVTAN